MVTSVLRDEQYMFGVRSFLVAEKVLLVTNNKLCQVVVMTGSLIAVVDSFNEFRQFFEK